jgi:hypothetical protein
MKVLCSTFANNKIHVKIILLFLLLSFTTAGLTQPTIFPAPVDYPYANDFKVKVNDKESFVYENRVAAYTIFEIEGETTVEVAFFGKIYDVDIRPKSLNIVPRLTDGKIIFTLSKPCNLSVEINKNLKRPLFVFANSPVEGKPVKGDPRVLYFEGGKVYHTGRITLKSNDIVYIESGAVVKGSLFLDSIQNVHIYGHGILDGACVYEKGQERMIEINRCENITVEGILINESKHWTAPCNKSKNITYKNIKVVSGNDWDDGIDIVSSQHVLVDGCFIRTKDDCIALKAGVNYYTDFFNQLPAKDVQVINSVLWNAEWGNGLEIGFETRADTIQDVLFRNCDLIHVEGPEGTFTIHNGDRAVIRNVLYENIRVEDSRGILVDFKILNSQYSKDKNRGQIKDITFRNISINADILPPSLLLGYDESHTIDNVVFDNFRVNGRQIKSMDDLNATFQYSNRITFK